MKETKFEDDVSIDSNDLKEEARKQPNLYYKWGKKYGIAHGSSFQKQEELKLVKSEAKQMVEKVKAEIDQDIRSDPSAFGFEKKPTETAISSTIILQDKYQKTLKTSADMVRDAIEDTQEAIETEDVMESAKTAMQHRKGSLESLVTLFVNGFNSEVKASKRFRDKKQAEQDEKNINDELNDSMTKRKTKKEK